MATSPLRSLLTLLILVGGPLLLWMTRPRPLPNQAPLQGQSLSCLDNLSQISRAYALYARDFDGKIPLAIDPEDRFNTQLWQPRFTDGTPYTQFLRSAPYLHVVLRPYVASPQVFHCPADTGWAVSRLAQFDASTGQSIGLKNVRPSSFARYGTSYYLWTIYGFNLVNAVDVANPARKTLLFDGDLWHANEGGRAGELFLDGHAALLSKAQHEAATPQRDFFNAS